MVKPSCSSRRNSGQVAQSPTRLEFAISTRGAHSWVRQTPTGLPDCTSIVSSSASVVKVRTIASKHAQSPAARPVPVDDQIVGALGVFRVQIVHQHSQWRLGHPTASGASRAMWSNDRTGTFHMCSPYWGYSRNKARSGLVGVLGTLGVEIVHQHA